MGQLHVSDLTGVFSTLKEQGHPIVDLGVVEKPGQEPGANTTYHPKGHQTVRVVWSTRPSLGDLGALNVALNRPKAKPSYEDVRAYIDRTSAEFVLAGLLVALATRDPSLLEQILAQPEV